MELTVNDISFRAKLGKNILHQVNKEFNYDKARVDKFVRLFDDAFVANIDKETVIDINKNNNLVFSNNNFPSVKYQYNSKFYKNYSFTKRLINECSKVFVSGEINLFRIIISKCINSGVDFKQLEKAAKQNISNPKSIEYFLENLKIAERIKKETPDSSLTREEFSYMQNIMMQEEVEIPGTKLYDIVHKLDEIGLEFSA